MSESVTQPPGARPGRLDATGATPPPAVDPPATAPARPGAGAALRPKVLRAAWLSIALGLGIEVLLLAAAAFGGKLQGLGPIVAELAQKVSWSVLVCVGIAFGTAAARARSSVMGLLGLASAPLAFSAARAVHKGVSSALSAATAMAPGPAPILLALLKALEYGFLGALVGWAGRRWGKVAAYVGAGAAVGLTLGTLTVVLMSHADAAAAPAATLASRGIDEMLFPVGCSLVLYAADRVGRHVTG